VGTNPLTNQAGKEEFPKPKQDQKASPFVQSLSSSPYSDSFAFKATNIDRTALANDDEELSYDDESDDNYDGGIFSDRYSPLRNLPPPPPLEDTIFTPRVKPLKRRGGSPMFLPTKNTRFRQVGPTSRCPHSRMTVRT